MKKINNFILKLLKKLKFKTITNQDNNKSKQYLNKKTLPYKKDFIFEDATLEDLNYIKKLCKEGVKEGHYKKRLTENSTNFDNTIRALILRLDDLKNQSRPYTWIIKYKNIKIGFITMSYYFNYGSVEFHYLSLEKKFQNKSLGTQIVKEMETEFKDLTSKEIYQNIFISRCNRKKSKAMIKVFRKNNYRMDKDKNIEKGWVYLIKDKSLRVLKQFKYNNKKLLFLFNKQLKYYSKV